MAKESKIELPSFIKEEYLENGDPMPRSLDRLAQILQFLYKLADHPFLGQWRSFDDINPFNVKKLSDEGKLVLSRTVVERSIWESFHFAKINLNDRLPVSSSKSIEYYLADLNILVTVINGTIDKKEDELSAHYAEIINFRIRLSAILQLALVYISDTCINLIIAYQRDIIAYQIKNMPKEEIHEYLLRKRKELKQNEQSTTPKVYKEVMAYLEAELDLYNNLKASNGLEQLQQIVQQHLESRRGIIASSEALACLAANNFEGFFTSIKEWVLLTLSSFDLAGKQQEQLYHVLLLGILSRLEIAYVIKSNGESGLGRYDIALIPRHDDLLPLIFELKSIPDKGATDHSLDKAIEQIVEKKYSSVLKQDGYKRYAAIGTVFVGKDLYLKHAIVDIA